MSGKSQGILKWMISGNPDVKTVNAHASIQRELPIFPFPKFIDCVYKKLTEQRAQIHRLIRFISVPTCH